MANKLDVKTLGHSGVILDQNSLEPTLPDDALVLAQNATHDPTQGYGGALRKRAGFTRFNTVSAGGIILGGIPMPVAGTGGAPVGGGGGDTGSPDGDGTGTPGGTVTGDPPAYAPPGGGVFGGPLFSGRRLLIIGREDNTLANHYGQGWYVGSKQMADATNLVATPGPPCTIGNYAQTTFVGSPSCITPDGFLYYIQSHNESTREAATIRKTNGAVDVAVAVIPINSFYPGSGTWLEAVTWLHYADNGKIYLTVIDKVSSGSVGRLLKLDPLTNALTELNTGGPATTPGQYAALPSCCARHEGKVFWGTAPNVADTSASINVMSSDETYAYTDYHPADDERFANIACMLETADGVLIAGSGEKSVSAANRPVLLFRQPNAEINAVAAWDPQDIDDGDAAVTGSFYPSLVEFNGSVYASFFVPSTKAKIYKLTIGVDAGSGKTLATAFTTSFASVGSSERVPFFLFVDDGVLYAWGTKGLGNGNHLIWTTDGVTWTDASTNYPTTNQSITLPIGLGVAQ